MLSNLRRDKSITVKPTDKGTCIVVQDTKDYLEEGLKELSDESTYKEIEDDNSKKIAKKANDLIEEYYNRKLLTHCMTRKDTPRISRKLDHRECTGYASPQDTSPTQAHSQLLLWAHPEIVTTDT